MSNSEIISTILKADKESLRRDINQIIQEEVGLLAKHLKSLTEKTIESKLSDFYGKVNEKTLEDELFTEEFDCEKEGVLRLLEENKHYVHYVDDYNKYKKLVPNNKFKCFRITQSYNNESATLCIGKNVIISRNNYSSGSNYGIPSFHNIPLNYLLCIKLCCYCKDQSGQSNKLIQSQFSFNNLLKNYEEYKYLFNESAVELENIFRVEYAKMKKKREDLDKEIVDFNSKKEFYNDLHSSYKKFLDEKKKFEEEKKKLALVKIHLDKTMRDIEREKQEIEEEKRILEEKKAEVFDVDGFLKDVNLEKDLEEELELVEVDGEDFLKDSEGTIYDVDTHKPVNISNKPKPGIKTI